MKGFFFQAEDGIRDLVRSRGLGDVYKRQEVELELGEVELLRQRHRAHHLIFGLRLVDDIAQALSLIHI
mgnify:CR=1 FL=1